MVFSEEILKSDKAFWFSPSGRFLAYVTFDDSMVGEYKYPIYNTKFQYPYYQSLRYPKVSFGTILIYNQKRNVILLILLLNFI